MLKLKERNYDYTILVVTIILVMIGIVMVFSSSFYFAENSSLYNDGFYFFKKQIMGAIMGLVLMIFAMIFDYNKLGVLKYIGIIISLVLLSLVFAKGIGVEINKSYRWLNLGFITIQPSELAKFFLVVSIAKILNDNQDNIDKFKYSVLPVFLITASMCGLIALQPNYSAVLIICAIVWILMMIGGVRKTYLFGFIIIGIIAAVIAVLKEEHIIVRFFAFLTPEDDPSGKGYQILQSLYAIGSGGIFGRGVGNSMQKFLYLPYGQSDFIFSIFCEELGFFGAIVLMGLFFVLIFRGVRTAFRAPNVFGMLLATGITMTIAIQVLLNIAVVTKSMPPTGVLLPFISAGSTALIVFMAEIGILLNISHQGNRL